jgi:transcriptional regulator of acetoin/glycerol metabolism
VRRDRKDGLRRLVVTVPDTMMSAEHGRMVNARGGWVLDAPSSKNAVLLGGQRTRSVRISHGQVFALGNTLFTIDQAHEPVDGALDRLATELRSPIPAFATFDDELATGIDRLAATRVPVFLQGETGTGKEIAARTVHELSQRRGTFVAVNCSAITATLVEAELFGHRRGTFTGAIADRPGYVRSAEHGTLFLDEIGELRLDAQAALLRALQKRMVTPVGDAAPISVDFRLVSATHRDLLAMIVPKLAPRDSRSRPTTVSTPSASATATTCASRCRAGCSTRRAAVRSWSTSRDSCPLRFRPFVRSAAGAAAPAGPGRTPASSHRRRRPRSSRR